MEVSQLVSSIDATIASLDQGVVTADADRQQLLAAAKRLQAASESPVDAVVSIVLGQIHREAAIRTAVEMGLFDVLVCVKEEGITADELAKKTNSDETLITRIMRFVTALGYAKELGIRHYTSTPRTGVFVTGSPLRDPIIHMAVHSRVLIQLPEYFQKYGYKNPTDINAGPFQFAMNYSGTYFEWLKSNPVQQKTFNRMMAITRHERGEQWFEFFPTEERFGSTDPSQALLVDIGGGLGHDLAAFHGRFPNLPGRLILQDLPAVINDIKELSPAIERTVYDCFTPQPIKGARFYYLHTVLHDFPDKQSIQILKTIREAMTSESVLLLNENFLPEKDVPLYNAEMDFSMLALFSAMDRTNQEWIALLEAAGLEVVKIWTLKEQLVASGTLFEAVRKD